LELLVQEEAIAGSFNADFFVKILEGEARAGLFEGFEEEVGEEAMLRLVVGEGLLVGTGSGEDDDRPLKLDGFRADANTSAGERAFMAGPPR